ncbi:MAG: hypothetical protein ACMUIL_01650 [bacterium]
MKGNVLAAIMGSIVIIVLVFAFAVPCSSQFIPYPFWMPINPFFSPTFGLFPAVSPVTAFFPASFSPVLGPYTALPSFASRNAAATLVVLPPAAPAVTAYAPLGTLNITPSSLVLLILYLTLAE